MTHTTPTADDAPETRGDFAVPDDGEAVRCRHCGAPFADDELLALHRGLDHPGDLSADERAAFETAYDAEQEEIRRFRLLALGVLVLLYFGLLMTYAVVA